MRAVGRMVLVFAGLLLLWQGIVVLGKLPPYLLPTPLQVAQVGFAQWHLILQQAQYTVLETLLGFIVGSGMGAGSALLLMLFRPLRLWLLPVLVLSQAIPTFALAPLLVVWFGYGMASKIITTALMLFFPVASSFFDGLRQTNAQWLDMAYTMGASRRRTLWYIRVPAALPSLASGLRVAAVFAPLGAVIGEWVGSSRGLGFLMLNANARLEIALMFACLFTIVMMALALYFTVDTLLRLALPWKRVAVKEVD